MKLLGEPLDKIKELAEVAGLDPTYLDQDFPDYRLNADYRYFLEEMQRSTAIDVLKEKMLQRGLDPTVLDVYYMGAGDTVRVDYMKYIHWFILKEQGGDLAEIRLKMEQEGLDSSYIDRDVKSIEFYNIPYDTVVNSFRNVPESVAEPTQAPGKKVCTHKYSRKVPYQYYKKFKQLKMGMPKEQVKQKMQLEGLDPSILDLDMNTLEFTDIPEDDVVRYDDGHYEPCWKEDPNAEPAQAPKKKVCTHKYSRKVPYQYYKKFKQLKMGMPKEQVKQKMQLEGLDPSILDLDMNTLEFTDIPEDDVVRYDDGHYEPCWKEDPNAEPVGNPKPQSKSKPQPQPQPQPDKENLRDPRPPLSIGLKLRHVHWDVNNLDASIRNSMWSKMDDREIKIDREAIEKEFQMAATTNIIVLPTSQSEKVTTLFSANRERNIGIVLGRIHLSTQDIHRALLFSDFNILTKELVNKLVATAPTQEEQATFINYNGDVNSLSKASQFGYYLSDIPNIKTRINCYKIVLTFDDEVEQLRSSLQVYYDAFKMVRNNKGLFTIIEIILAVGNFLNGDSAIGGAWGFRINFLTKLKNTKSADSTKTLMT